MDGSRKRLAKDWIVVEQERMYIVSLEYPLL
jgi:hypothetical protein